MKIEAGKKYVTRGGWIAFISTSITDNVHGLCVLGWCYDDDDKPLGGIWNPKTGECVRRGDNYEKEIIAPFDLIEML